MKKLLTLTMLLVFLFGFSGGAQAAPAASKWEKACEAYSEYLTQNESKYKMSYDASSKNPESNNTIYDFMLVDIDKNKVPEMIGIHYENARYALITVFTYKSSKVKKIKTFEAISTAQGRYASYICKKRHFHLNYIGGYVGHDDCAYKLKSGKFKLYAEHKYEALPNKTTVKVNGKKKSENDYFKAVQKCDYDKKFEYYRNKKSNREKYLK